MRLACRAACLAALLMAAQPWPAVAQGQEQEAPPVGTAPVPGDSGAAGVAPAPQAPGAPGIPPAAGPTPADGGDGAAMPPAAVGAEPSGTVVRATGDDDGAAVVSPVLTINEGALYAGSAWGRRVQADLERLSHELAAENDRIYDELAAQEEALTALRATLPPEEFRSRAEAFDDHAQAVRAERQAVVRDLNDLAETERQNFFAVSVPVFAEVMAERGAMVIVDQRMVFISVDAVDVTETLIQRIDAEIGAGPAVPPQP